MTRILLLILAMTFAPAASLAAAAAPETPLIARDALFGNPEKTQGRISPDGRHFSWVAPRDGVLNVWVAPAGDLAARARPVTNDRQRGIRQHFWMANGTHVLYLQDQGGDENWRLHGVEIATGTDRDLTPIAGVQAQVIGLSPERPGTVLVGLNDRVPEWHDVYEIDVATGERRLVLKNEENLAGFFEDLQLAPRLATRSLADGDEILRRTPDGWERVLSVSQADTLTTGPITIEQGGKTALLLSSVDRNTSALVRLDLATGAVTPVAQDERSDVADVWLHPRTRALQAYTTEYLTVTHTALDPPIAKDIEALTKALGPGFTVVSGTLDDRRWVVAADQPEQALSYHLYDRDDGRITKLFDARPALAGAPLVAMTPVEIRARDGLTLVGYLSRPRGVKGPVPLVLSVHGGPWGRDSFGFDPEHQWFANRGYAVLAVNFRGSTGFGKSFVNAGDREWAGKMHDDLIDAIEWAVRREAITTPDRIAIYGGIVRRLRDPRRPGLHADPVRLRRRHRRAVEPEDTARLDTALLEVVLRGVHAPGRRSAHPGGQEVARGPVAADARRRDRPAAADRARGERPARQAGRVRPDRRGDEAQGNPGHLRAVSRRGTRIRAAREQHLVLRDHRGLPRAVPGRALRTRRRRLPGLEPRGQGRRTARPGSRGRTRRQALKGLSARAAGKAEARRC